MHDLNNLPNGFRFVETPGHGYLHLQESELNKMPDYLRKFHPFEEDCAFAIAVCFFAHLFKPEIVESCERTFKTYHWQEWEKWKGVELAKGESTLKDQLLFYRENVGKYATCAAWGDWHDLVPNGFVGVCARLLDDSVNEFGSKNTESEKYFLVKKEKYENRVISYLIEPDDIEVKTKF